MTPDLEREIQLRALAASGERRNRPRALPIAACGLLAVGALFAGWSALEAGSARAELVASTNQATEVRKLLAQMDTIRRDPARRLDTQRYAPDQQILAKLAQSIPDRIGMNSKPAVTEARTVPLAPDSKLVSRQVRAILQDVRLEQAMEWINAALREVQGLAVTNVEFTPTRDRGWVVTVDLARWESRQ